MNIGALIKFKLRGKSLNFETYYYFVKMSLVESASNPVTLLHSPDGVGMTTVAQSQVRGSYDNGFLDSGAAMRVDASAQMFKQSAGDMPSLCEVKGEGSIQASNLEERNARNLQEYNA